MVARSFPEAAVVVEEIGGEDVGVVDVVGAAEVVAAVDDIAGAEEVVVVLMLVTAGDELVVVVEVMPPFPPHPMNSVVMIPRVRESAKNFFKSSFFPVLNLPSEVWSTVVKTL